MKTRLIESNEKYVTLQIKIPYSKTFLETEANIQTALNEAGTVASGEAFGMGLRIISKP